MTLKPIVIFTLGMIGVPAGWAQDAPRQLTAIDPTNLPAQKIGKEDLLGVTVYDSPELTHTYRVMGDGHLRMPMLKTTIPVEGLLPADVEVLIADELKREALYVDPFVTVAVVEYHSRPISVTGAVKAPIIFQAVGSVHLLDAIAKGGGLDTTAGGEIIVTRPNGDAGAQSIQRIPVRALYNGADPSLNIKLTGGEEVRVPPAATIIVTGNVKTPGVYPVQESGTSTVWTAIAQAQGWGMYIPTKAYIYRNDEQGQRHEIEIDLKAIRNRKKPDVVLQAKDILYLPENRTAKNVDLAIQAMTGLSTAAGAAIIYTSTGR
ncbi:MAG: polysaccharide biosynthesis/export family protein [Bryobacteraceae bacterium]|jgi:polysaccharide export outer membrane protein